MKKIVLFFIFSFVVYANPITNLSELNRFHFEDAFEKEVIIPQKTKKIFISFDKIANEKASDFFNKQSKDFLSKNNSIYIGDIHKMPSFVTYMFARPKMQKYNFTIYLYNKKGLEETIPYKTEHITLLEFGEKGELVNITFHKEVDNLF